MSDGQYPIQIDGKRWTIDWMTAAEHADKYKNALRRAYTQGLPIQCRCPGTGDKQLSIRHLQGSDKYILARYPDSGEQHAMDCQHYAPNPQKSGRQQYRYGVVTENPDGTINIRTRLGLREAGNADEQAEPETAGGQERTRNGKTSRTAISLLGLLHLLWETAGLNRWHPKMQGKRNPSRMAWWIQQQADNIYVRRHPIGQNLLIGCKAGQDQTRAQNNQQTIARLKQKHQRALILSPLAKWKADRPENPGHLLLSWYEGLPKKLKLDTGLWETVTQKYPRAISHWRDGHTCIVLAQIQIDTEQGGTILDLALMSVTSHEYLPVDSRFERQVAERLVQQQRHYTKPLRYDADADLVFPDFVLQDTDAPEGTPMEVFGRNDPAYLTRKQQKTDYYQSNFGVGHWWSWNAIEQETIPDFPPARNQK